MNIYNQDSSNTFLTLQQARQDLISEVEAIIQYDNHIQSTSNSVAKQTWIDIRDEEMVHVGQLLALMNYINPAQKQFVEKGIREFNERFN